MAGFRLFLALWLLIIIGYTAVVTAQHGPDLLPVFLGDIAALGWPGQFNVDFSSFLMLSAVWVAWRHHCSIGGLALALVAAVGGGLFLTSYLLIASWQEKGNMAALLMGKTRAAALRG